MTPPVRPPLRGRPEPWDPETLRRLGDSIDDQAVADRFADRYAQLLPSRIARISDALLAADLDAALDASLSLKTASATVGTAELERLAVAIEEDVREGALASACRRADDLPAAVVRATAALRGHLDRGA